MVIVDLSYSHELEYISVRLMLYAYHVIYEFNPQTTRFR